MSTTLSSLDLGTVPHTGHTPTGVCTLCLALPFQNGGRAAQLAATDPRPAGYLGMARRVCCPSSGGPAASCPGAAVFLCLFSALGHGACCWGCMQVSEQTGLPCWEAFQGAAGTRPGVLPVALCLVPSSRRRSRCCCSSSPPLKLGLSHFLVILQSHLNSPGRQPCSLMGLPSGPGGKPLSHPSPPASRASLAPVEFLSLY